MFTNDLYKLFKDLSKAFSSLYKQLIVLSKFINDLYKLFRELSKAFSSLYKQFIVCYKPDREFFSRSSILNERFS